MERTGFAWTACLAVAVVIHLTSAAEANEQTTAPAIAERPDALCFDLSNRDDVRAAYHHAMRQTNPWDPPSLDRSVSNLIAVAEAVTELPGLSAAEAAGMRRAMKTRLERIRDRLIREERRRTADSRREARFQPRVDSVRTPAQPGNEKALPGGGAMTAARAQQLIDVITTTIAPESWEDNGGRGRIRFYSPLNVLVIRASGDVHGEIGGALDQLRK